MNHPLMKFWVISKNQRDPGHLDSALEVLCFKKSHGKVREFFLSQLLGTLHSQKCSNEWPCKIQMEKNMRVHPLNWLQWKSISQYRFSNGICLMVNICTHSMIFSEGVAAAFYNHLPWWTALLKTKTYRFSAVILQELRNEYFNA